MDEKNKIKEVLDILKIKSKLGKEFKEKKKPRLMICCNLWMIGGIERVMQQLINYFEQKYEIVLVSYVVQGKAYELPDSVEHFYLENQEDCAYSIGYRVSKLAIFLETDLYIGNANLAIEFLEIYEYLQKSNIKTIMMNHTSWIYPYKYEGFLCKEVEYRNQIIDKPNVVCFLTNIFSELAENTFNRTIVTMPNPNTYTNYNEEIDKREETIIAVARFEDPIKRLDKIFRIYKKLSTLNSSVKLCIVGNIDWNVQYEYNGKTLKKMVEELEIPMERVEYVGETTKIEQYYKRAKALMLTSETEGFARILTEAGNYGVPVVSYYYSGIEDVIEDGKNGFLVEDEDMFVNKLNILLKDEKIYHYMKTNTQKFAERFEKNKIMKRWEELFAILLTSKSQEEIDNRIATNNLFTRMPSDIKVYKKCIEEYQEILEGIIRRTLRCEDIMYNLNMQLSESQEEIKMLKNLTNKNLLIKKIMKKLHNGIIKNK